MFVQHHSQKSNAKDSLSIPSKDFELIIHSKSLQKITGIIQFQYLQNTFSAAILITPTSIQIKGQQGFDGIQLAAPFLPNTEITECFYVEKGMLSKKGDQNIVWLILDFIHLYNVLRLKPGKVLELYREAFNIAKVEDPSLVFGHLDINSQLADKVSLLLGKQWKRNFKYEFGNNLGLLASIQTLLANYPHQFTPTVITNLEQSAII
jgi:hypothetical protein